MATAAYLYLLENNVLTAVGRTDPLPLPRYLKIPLLPWHHAEISLDLIVVGDMV